MQLVVLEDDVCVEALDERAAVVSGGEHSVVFQLDDGFLNRDPAHAQLPGDLVAVDPVAGAQLAGQDLVEDVSNDQVLFL